MPRKSPSQAKWTPLGNVAHAVVVSALDAFAVTPPEAGVHNTVDTKTDGEEKPSLHKRSQLNRLRRISQRVVRPEPDPETGEVPKLPTVCSCGFAGYQAEAVTLVRSKTGGKALGVFRCKSGYGCPVCSMAKTMKRQVFYSEAETRARARSFSMAMVTLTVGRNRYDPLSEVHGILKQASKAARNSRQWKDIEVAHGVIGICRFPEFLHGERTGWHPHEHLLIFGSSAPDVLLQAAQALTKIYLAYVAKFGGRASVKGQDARLCYNGDGARYAAKGSLAFEAAGGLKEARSAQLRTPLQLLMLAGEGDARAKSLYREYFAETKGLRPGRMSPRLLAALDMENFNEDDSADADGTGTDPADEDVVCLTVGADSWNRIVRRGHDWLIFKAIEEYYGLEPLEELVRRYGSPDPEFEPWKMADKARMRGASEIQRIYN